MSEGQNGNDSVKSKLEIKPVLPDGGLTHVEDVPRYVLCKPRILAMKSVTLEKLEQMQKEALSEARAQRQAEMDANATSAF